jgi:mRNA interferase YafQ
MHTTFAEAIETVESLSFEEKESLVEIFQSRLRDQRREQISRSIAESRQEFAEGKLKPSSVDEIMDRILKRNPEDASDIRETIGRLSRDPFDSKLKTHKLKGKHKDCWSCSAGYDLRIIFEFIVSDGEQCILLHTVGTHDDVY